MNIIFLGAPGAGKGTQAEIVSKRLSIPTISTGAMIKSGYVYENMMINLKPSNVKLKDRTIRGP